MRRAEHLMTTERALTLALVLVAVGYAPGAISYALQRSASIGLTAVSTSSRSSEARTAACKSEHRLNRVAPTTDGEVPTGTPAVPAGESCEIAAPRTTPNPFAFLTPPSERGPPTLG